MRFFYANIFTHHACADFEFDVSSHYPPWIQESDEEESIRVRLRSEARAAAQAAAVAPAPAARGPCPRLLRLTQMGFNVALAQAALDAAEGDCDAAIHMLVDD